MHNAAFDAAGIDARYELLELEPEDVEAAVTAARGPEFLGLGVTAPYKKVVASLVDEVEPDAARIGAVNNVVRSEDGRLIGINTDAPGFGRARAGELEAAVTAARGPDFLGLGVTAPYKKVVAGLCDEVEADAATIGAVNNVVRKDDGRLVGINTDAPGFRAGVELAMGRPLAGANVVVAGAGGAAHAVVYACLAAGRAARHDRQPDGAGRRGARRTHGGGRRRDRVGHRPG